MMHSKIGTNTRTGRSFAVLVSANATATTSTFAARASGTLNERPVIEGRLPGGQVTQAVLTGLLKGLHDVQGYLRDGDELKLTVNGAISPILNDMARSPAAIKADNSLLCDLRMALRKIHMKGVDYTLVEATEGHDPEIAKALKQLSSRAHMSAAMGQMSRA